MKINNDKKLGLIINLMTVCVMVVIVLVAVFIYRDNIFGTTATKSTTEEKENPSLSADVTPERSTQPPSFEKEIVFDYPPGYTEAPMSDFTQYMFDYAIDMPGSPYKIEPPPKGRSIDLQYGAVPLSELIPEPFGYFGDIVLLGDSVTTGFDLFREKVLFYGEAVLRDITVVAIPNYGAYNAIQDISGVHPILNGQKSLPEDIIAQKKQKNIFICFGLNDLVWQKPEHFVIYYSRLIDRIRTKNPEKNIAIMSVTPCVAGQTSSELNNAAIAEANNFLLEYASQNGVYFIDYAAVLRDGENNLYDILSSDGYTHLTTQAYERLVEYMLYHPIK